MTRDLISRITRNEFREALTDFTLRDIEMIFQAGDLEPRAGHNPNVGGQRRTLVEQYYANIDFGSLADVRKVLRAYSEFMEQLRRMKDRPYNPTDTEPITENLTRIMQRDGFIWSNGQFSFGQGHTPLLETRSLLSLTHDSISEHAEKARAKIENGDNSGAIASAYTLVEEFLKELLRRCNVPFKREEGDIRELYKLAADPLHLNPSGDNLENHLKTILQGLKSQISGLYEVANKASDRHARRYNPARHHAKLAVNVALLLCEFLLDSHEYQQTRKVQRGAA